MTKTAIVTGGSDGIGKALVIRLAEAGYTVITCGRSAEKAKEFEGHKVVKFFVGDLSNAQKLDQFLAYILQHSQKVDLLVNNAGVQIGNALLVDASLDDIKKMFCIHVEVPLVLLQKLKDHFVPTETKIINIVSVVVKNYLKETYGPYTITKYAQYGLGNMMIKELAKQDVRVTNVILGGVNTSIRPEPRPQYLSPDDVAQAIIKVTEFPSVVYCPEIFLSPQNQL